MFLSCPLPQRDGSVLPGTRLLFPGPQLTGTRQTSTPSQRREAVQLAEARQRTDIAGQRGNARNRGSVDLRRRPGLVAVDGQEHERQRGAVPNGLWISRHCRQRPADNRSLTRYRRPSLCSGSDPDVPLAPSPSAGERERRPGPATPNLFPPAFVTTGNSETPGPANGRTARRNSLREQAGGQVKVMHRWIDRCSWDIFRQRVHARGGNHALPPTSADRAGTAVTRRETPERHRRAEACQTVPLQPDTRCPLSSRPEDQTR